MASIIKLTASIHAAAGDWLLIEKDGVRVVRGEAFEAALAPQRRRRADAPPAPPKGPRTINRTRPPHVIARESELVDIVANFPGSPSAAIGALCKERMADNLLTATLHVLAKRGALKRASSTGQNGRLSWLYYPADPASQPES